MRVAIVQEHVAVQRGGAETSTLEMARHLAALGLEVTIVCRGDSDRPFVDQNVTFLPVVVRGLSRTVRTYRFVQGARLFCRRERFDIVHAITPCLAANVYQPRGGTYPETVARGLALVRSPLLRELKRVGRRFNVRQRFLARLEGILLRKYRRRVFVAALSEYVRRQVERDFGFPGARTRVVFNGVDIAPLTEEERSQYRSALRAELGLSPQTPLLLFVAHNFRLKGLTELLQATAVAARANCGPRFTVVVAGRDRPQRYQRLARRLGVAAQVRFVGAAPDIRPWYAAADVLAHPTWYDPCSRVALEALCLGLPVVTTRYNGAAEVMEPGRHGEIIAEPDDPADLAAALERALQPAVGASCQGDAARVRERLSMGRHARELRVFYEDVLARGQESVNPASARRPISSS
jgi:UDP-glucose:(heptosyl)LPS alpha-1,3-glucosyltransferase